MTAITRQCQNRFAIRHLTRDISISPAHLDCMSAYQVMQLNAAYIYRGDGIVADCGV